MATKEGRVNPDTGEIEDVDVPESQWEDLSPEVFKFENVDDAVEGVYMGSTIQNLDGEDTTRHDIETPSGPRFFWGSTTLDGSLKPVREGDYIRITYTGVTDKAYRGGNPAKLYKVQRRKRT